MSQDRFGDATRRAFLGTATVATAAAATLTAPVAGEAQTADTGHPVGTTKLAASERRCSHSADVTRQSGRLDETGGDGHPQGGIFRA